MNQLAISRPVVDGASATNYQSLKPGMVDNRFSVLALAICFVSSVYCGWMQQSIPDLAAWFCSIWLLLSLAAAVLITPRLFTVGYLISLLSFLIAWRIAAINGAQLQMIISGLCAIPLFFQFVDCVANDLRSEHRKSGAWLASLVWQFTVVRMCFGLNELCHATEKLFGGFSSFHHMEKGFQAVGLVEGAAFFVVLGGLIELASAISVGLGVFARLGALMSTLYFLVATIGFGGEWTRGYAWASAGGGGWEYVMLLLVVFGGVMATGAGKFSVDGWLLSKAWFPRWLKAACVSKQGY